MAKKKKIRQQKKPVKKPARQQAKKGLPANFDDQVKSLTAMAMSIIHNTNNKIEANQLPNAYEQALQTAQHKEDAGPKAVADVAMWVFSQVERAAKDRGKSIRPVVLLGVVGTIVEQIAEVATVAGVCEMSEEDIQIAIATAVNLFVDKAKNEGTVTDQQLKEAAQALQAKYPGGAEAFQKMVSDRQARQTQGGGQAQGQQTTDPAQGQLLSQNPQSQQPPQPQQQPQQQVAPQAAPQQPQQGLLRR